MVSGLSAMSQSDQTPPTVTLSWSDAFISVPPWEFTLTVSSTKLSGSPAGPATTVTISAEETENAMFFSNQIRSYDVGSLTFHTEYQFTLVATYNLTGTPVDSDPVVTNHETREGGTSFNTIHSSNNI